MPETTKRIGVCGLDCVACDLYLLPTDEAVQARMLAWFRQQGWLDEDEGLEVVLAQGMYCRGCGDPDVCWSDACTLLACCRGDKGLATCADCDAFPCDKIETHRAASPRYAEGVAYLERLRARNEK